MAPINKPSALVTTASESPATTQPVVSLPREWLRVNEAVDYSLENQASLSSPYLTPKQLSYRWQCSEMKLRRMRATGKLPVSYLGRSARYLLADVERIEAEARV